MDFELSAEQLALQDAARTLLAKAASSERVREVLDAPEGYDLELWRLVAEQGWLVIELPEADGGLGLSVVELAVLAEAMGRVVAPVPVLSTALALAAVARAEDPEPVSDWLERLAAGEAKACLVTHPGPVVDAPIADVAIRIVGEEVRLVELAGRVPAAEPAMDQTRRLSWADSLPEDGVRLGGPDLAQELADRASALYAAEMLGASERMLEESVAYAKMREQFGRPIGSFQAIKHRLADMLTDVEGMRSAAYYAAWALADGADDRSLAASTAKAWCSDASQRVMDSALQVHGGVGFTWEHDLHLYLKRAQLDQILHGNATEHRRRVAALLRERIRSGADLW